ncbi:MAG: BtpA/SgcQ family protein, partial [Planctomycetota bacterium]
KAATPDTPVIVGSGVTPQSAPALIEQCADAMIVGSALKPDNDPTQPIDPERVRQIIDAIT